MFFEDYALYFEDGMTYRSWLHKYGCSWTYDYAPGTYDSYYFYVPEEYLDTLCSAGYGNRLEGGWTTGFMASDQVGYYSNGIFCIERFFYSYGLIGFKKFDSP
jgi:hypothetical protein